jgi:2-hydroxychromene-2-carboxylate isomerase
VSRQERIQRRLSPWFTRTLLSPRLRDARRALAEAQRRLTGQPRRVAYFHQVDDPYSQLAVQTLAALGERYEIALEVFLVGPPPDAAAPERQRLEAYARKDAADVAPGYGLEFPRRTGAPDPALVGLASRILAGARESGSFVQAAPRVGSALFADERPALEALAREFPPAAQAATEAAIEEGSARRERLGHYLGAMFYYAPEWYWGVDRLRHLETRLEGEGARRAGAAPGPIVAPPDFSGRDAEVPKDRRFTLEFFLSLRSPYTYIVMERIRDLGQRLPVDVVQRPVLPMVMRGLPLPRSKKLYIPLDTKREADAAGVRFGNICDPVGEPVERGFSLYGWARERGRGPEFLLEFARAAFADGVDTGSDEGLRLVVERAGLSWADARVDRDGWRAELEQNRKTMLGLGLWGVPSFRLRGDEDAPDFCTWGQDRVWLIEQEIRRRAGAPTR